MTDLESIKRDCGLWNPIGTRRTLEMVAEIERLRNERDELLEFTKEWLDRQGTDENYMTTKARAAIAKVEQSK